MSAGIALVAGVARVGGRGDLRDVLRHHRRVAAVAVAGQQQGVAAHGVGAAVRAYYLHAGDTPAVGEQGAHPCLGHQHHAGRLGRLREAPDQPGTGLLRHRVHARDAVAGVQEAFQHMERDGMRVGQPFQRRARGRGDGARDGRVRAVVVLVLDVGGEQLGRVLHADGALPARMAGRDEAGGQRRGALRHRVAFQHHAFDAGVGQGQRGGKAAGAAADDGHRRARSKRDGARENRHGACCFREVRRFVGQAPRGA